MTLGALRKLHGNGRIRKAALLLERLERACISEAAVSEANMDARELAKFLMIESESGSEVFLASRRYLDPENRESDLRRLNDFRHALMRASGQAPADWDFLDHSSAATRIVAPIRAATICGLRVYLEDVRSPFNVGTILRTAEAFGFEEVLLSPDCADPRHPRAMRSAMGAVDYIPWRRIDPTGLGELGPLVALELGGQDIGAFNFPRQGTLILGSEELGISAHTLSLPGLSRVSIPMRGKKASINVAVAFGIAAQAWVGIFR